MLTLNRREKGVSPLINLWATFFYNIDLRAALKLMILLQNLISDFWEKLKDNVVKCAEYM